MFLSTLHAVGISLLSVAGAYVLERGLPATATGVTTITSPSGVTIRYKEPGKAGVCETTAGVNSYSGYVDLDNATHMFFWFFEARNDPANAPLTLWLNGGPGSDSMIGLFQELGPCNINLSTDQSELNPYSWSEVSNMLFLSQPIGVGFSYASEHEIGGSTINSFASGAGRIPAVNPTTYDTTELAAVGAWHVLQGFLANLPKLDPQIKVKNFNLWTESYGGHYGNAFYDYFYDANLAIANGTQKGVQLVMDTLGIGNGIIDELIQVAFYPDFAVNNTYGIKAVDDITYLAMKTAYSQPGGCKDQATACAAADRSTTEGQWICSNATNFCRSNVEGPYYATNHGAYDIRQPADDPTPPQNFIDYLNTAPIQQALGVNLNYTSDASDTVSEGFQETGDFSYPDFKVDLEHLLNEGVRVALYYGDADYICNWFGGEAISLAVNWTHADQFRAAGYTPFMVDGTEYGQVRQVGNYSFLRIYESGHEVPYYQPKASLEFFRRVLGHVDVALGTTPVTAGYVTNGTANSTYSEASGTSSGAATPTQSGAAKPTSSKSAGTRRIARPFWW